jgi:hypothetical protein
VNLDRLLTQVQETGECPLAGLTAADVSEIVATLGLDGRRVALSDGQLVHLEHPRFADYTILSLDAYVENGGR